MRRFLPLLSCGLIAAVMAFASPAAEAASARDAASQHRVSAQRVAKVKPVPVARSAARSTTRVAAPSRSRISTVPARGRATATAQRATGKGKAVATRVSQNTRQAAACTIRRGKRSNCSSTSRVVSWQGGLPAMTMAQTGCPVGTVALLARGHDDVTRCMPM